MNLHEITVAKEGVLLTFEPATLGVRVSFLGNATRSVAPDPMGTAFQEATDHTVDALAQRCPHQRLGGGAHRLGRLTLCVSGKCSLACRYCYASRGSYGQTSAAAMADGTALQSITWALRTFGGVSHVHFFGGEPTLNLRAIDIVCEFCGHLHRRGELRHMPQFGLTTNGLNLEGRALDLIRRHAMSVAVSVDGPPELHDTLRPTSAGGGSFAGVNAGIRRLLEIGVEPEIECTYTREHMRRGVMPLDLLDFFADEFGCRVLHCPTVIAPEHSPWHVDLASITPAYAEAVRASAASLFVGTPRVLSVASRWIQCLAQRRPCPVYCPAARSSLAVDVNGTIYPCFMFFSNRNARMGRVTDANPHKGPWLDDLLIASDKDRRPSCQACWLQPLCFGCLGDDLARGNPALHWSSSPGESPVCDFRRALGTALLEGVAEGLSWRIASLYGAGIKRHLAATETNRRLSRFSEDGQHPGRGDLEDRAPHPRR